MQQSLLFSTYEYDVNGERCCKKTGEETVRYFLDGNKILGENRTYKDGTSEKELRYLYDADGLVGCEYRNQDYLFVRDALNNITAITHRNKRIVARYKYDTWGNCTVYNEDGEIDTDPISIGNVNPFRWKSYYLDLESNLYYANGSYYDPTKRLYLDASSIESVIENGLSSNRLDRNSLMCNNVLELACNPYTINTTTELHPDPTYDADENLPWWLVAMDWVRGILYDMTKWFNELHWSIKLTAGIILLAGAIIFTIATGGGGAGVISVLVQTAIGVGVGVGLYTVGSLLMGTFTWEGLANAALDAFLITSAMVFISSAVNAIKYACRGKQLRTEELKKQVRELSDVELKSFGERGKNQGFRQITGTHDDAMKFVQSQTTSLQEFAPGKLVGYNSRGVEFRIFPKPNTSYTSIRITGVDGLKGIKFMWP